MTHPHQQITDRLHALQGLRATTQPRFYRCEPSWSWAPAPFTDFDLWLVTGGAGQLTLNARDYALSSNRAFVMQPGDVAVGRQDPANRLRVFACHFLLPGLRREDAAVLVPPPDHAVRDPAALNGLMQGAVSAWRQDDPLARARTELYLQQILLQLLDEAHGPAPKADQPLAALMNAIQEEPGRPWQVQGMAAQVGLSRAQFTRRFVALAGMPPARFVIHARVNRATTLLRETDMPLAAIADELGYTDVYYFSRQYKAETGHPPSHERG